MKSSFIFENDEFILEVLYTYEKGMDGDGWLVPDDPDELEYEKINLINRCCFFFNTGTKYYS